MSYEETGFLVDHNDMIEVCEVSGLSRKNIYPNGDIVVNNTALYIVNRTNAKGTLKSDSESKLVEFKPFPFLLNIPKEQLHDGDTVQILNSLLCEEAINFSQPKIENIKLPNRKDGQCFIDYLYTLMKKVFA